MLVSHKLNKLLARQIEVIVLLTHIEHIVSFFLLIGWQWTGAMKALNIDVCLFLQLQKLERQHKYTWGGEIHCKSLTFTCVILFECSTGDMTSGLTQAVLGLIFKFDLYMFMHLICLEDTNLKRQSIQSEVRNKFYGTAGNSIDVVHCA